MAVNNKDYLNEPMIYLTIVIGLASVIHLLTIFFPNDPDFRPYAIFSVIMVWVSLLFKSFELFSEKGGFRNLAKDISKVALILAVVFQAIFIFTAFSNSEWWSKLTIRTRILYGGITIILLLKYFFPRFIKKLNHFLNIPMKKYTISDPIVYLMVLLVVAYYTIFYPKFIFSKFTILYVAGYFIILYPIFYKLYKSGKLKIVKDILNFIDC